MAWTTPRTWATGGTVTASQLNVDIRDNMNYLVQQAAIAAIDYPATIDPRYSESSRAFGTANQCHYNRVYNGGNITAIRMLVGTSSGSVSLAVYNTSGSGVSAVPSARQATSGAVACPATGVSDVSLAATVTVGHATHWFALSCSNTSATFRTAGTIPSGWTNGVNAAEASAHPAPASATPATMGSFLHVLIGV